MSSAQYQSMNSAIKGQIKQSDEVYLEWENINYYVPFTKKQAQLIDERVVMQDMKKGLPKAEIRQFDDSGSKKYRRILSEAKGYARPGELVAIMGPSGSGKTSLLNVLSQRTFLMPGGRAEGHVKINGKRLQRGDYAMLGAYVQ